MSKFTAVESAASNEPQALRPAYFPSATPLPDRPEYAGGIPIRALEAGLHCVIWPWDVMGVGDHVRLFWHNLTTEVASKDIQFDHELNQQVVLWVPRAQVLDGEATPVFYDVKRSNQAPERSDPLETYLVKTTRPGGYHNGTGDGHSGLLYTFLTDISEGVDADIAEGGVQMRIEPYQHMTAYDRIVGLWGGQFVTHYPVTQAQVDDPLNNPIIITFDRDVIRAAGDGERIVVTYQVIDCVGNRPDERAPWAKITYVEVNVDLDRLDPPLILVGGRPATTIDLDQLGDADVGVRLYTPASQFAVDDKVKVTWTGMPAQGSPIIVRPPEQIVEFVGFQLDFDIPNAAVKAIAGGFAKAAYVRIRSGEADVPSKSASVNVRGDLSRLPAPSVAQAPGGTLPADVPYATIAVPYYEGRKAGDLITIRCQGRRPDGGGTYHEIPIIVSNEPVGSPIERLLQSNQISPLDGGTLQIDYTVANDDELGIRNVRDSYPLPLRVGAAQGEFLAPDVAEADSNDVLLPENAPIGANITARFNDPVFDTRDGDVVGLRWNGSISGAHPTYEIPLNTHTAGEPVPFCVAPQYIGPNRNGTVELDYYLLRTGEPLRFSRKRVLSIGSAPPEYAAPTIMEANGNTLEPMRAKDVLTVEVPGTLQPDDVLSVTWSGTAGAGSYISEPKPVREIGQNIEIPVSLVANNLGRSVTVSYTVSRGGGPAKPSLPFVLDVQRIADEHPDFPTPRISRAQGNELDVTQLVGTDTLAIDRWPFPAVGQNVWLTLSCLAADNTNVPLVIWTGQAHNQEPGITLPLQAYLDWFKGRKDGATLSITFMVNLDKVPNEATAVRFPIRIFIVKTKNITHESFDALPNMTIHPGQQHNIGTMLITNNSNSYEARIAPISRPIPDQIEKQTLLISGSVMIDLTPPCSYASFWYSDVDTRNSASALFLGANGLLEKIPLQSHVFDTAFKMECSTSGISRIEITSTISDAIYLDNFELVR